MMNLVRTSSKARLQQLVINTSHHAGKSMSSPCVRTTRSTSRSLSLTMSSPSANSSHSTFEIRSLGQLSPVRARGTDPTILLRTFSTTSVTAEADSTTIPPTDETTTETTDMQEMTSEAEGMSSTTEIAADEAQENDETLVATASSSDDEDGTNTNSTDALSQEADGTDDANTSLTDEDATNGTDEDATNGSTKSTKVYVGNLSFACSEEELRQYFESYGPVEDVAMPLDKMTGRPRGFGFVTLKSGATDAIEATNGVEFQGRLLKVNESIPRSQYDGGRHGRGHIRGGSRFNNYNGGNYFPRTQISNDDETKLYVGNLHFDVGEDDLRSLFGKFGQISNINIPRNRETGATRGFAFVTLKTGALDAVKECDGNEFHGRQMRVNESRPRQQTNRYDGGSQGGYGSNYGNSGSRYGAQHGSGFTGYGSGYGGGHGGYGAGSSQYGGPAAYGVTGGYGYGGTVAAPAYVGGSGVYGSSSSGYYGSAQHSQSYQQPQQQPDMYSNNANARFHDQHLQSSGSDAQHQHQDTDMTDDSGDTN